MSKAKLLKVAASFLLVLTLAGTGAGLGQHVFRPANPTAQTAAAADKSPAPKKAGDKPQAPKEPEALLLRLPAEGMTLQLLPGYVHERQQGIDSLVGVITKKNGLRISYDIGSYGARSLEDELWHKEQTLHGLKVKIIFSKKKGLLVYFDLGPSLLGRKGASFYTREVKSEEDMAEALLILLSFRYEKK